MRNGKMRGGEKEDDFKKKKNHMRAERMGGRITPRPNSIGTSYRESWQQEKDDSI
jgi:hypothetical protein